jgi:acetyl-CoA carboxylase beta subunit
MLDAVVHRKEMRAYISRALEFMSPGVSHQPSVAS